MKKAKRIAETVARQMNYARFMPDVMERIKSSEMESQISEILHECRRRWCESEYESL